MPSHEAVTLAFRNRMLTLASLPEDRAFENVEFTPSASREYVEEELVPGGNRLVGPSTSGYVQYTGLYVVRWFGLPRVGTASINAGVDALLALFPPAHAMTLDDGTIVRVRGDVAPTRSQLRQQDGRPVITVSIPYEIHITNEVE